MKKIICLICIVLGLFVHAESQKPVKAKIKVFGNCPQCKERIENALDVKGIKMADWNIDSKILEVVYQPDKITIEKIHELVAQSGHDTEKTKAPDKTYLQLPECCMYRDNDNTHHD